MIPPSRRAVRKPPAAKPGNAVARADDVTDWLKQLRDEDSGQAEPPVGLEPEVTEPGAEEVQPVSDLTDWLSHLDRETPPRKNRLQKFRRRNRLPKVKPPTG